MGEQGCPALEGETSTGHDLSVLVPSLSPPPPANLSPTSQVALMPEQLPGSFMFLKKRNQPAIEAHTSVFPTRPAPRFHRPDPSGPPVGRPTFHAAWPRPWRLPSCPHPQQPHLTGPHALLSSSPASTAQARSASSIRETRSSRSVQMGKLRLQKGVGLAKATDYLEADPGLQRTLHPSDTFLHP